MAKKVLKEKEYRGQRDKVEAGLPWTYPFKMDNDVAKAVLNELDESPTGGDIRVILNNRLRKGFRIKK